MPFIGQSSEHLGDTTLAHPWDAAVCHRQQCPVRCALCVKPGGSLIVARVCPVMVRARLGHAIVVLLF